MPDYLEKSEIQRLAAELLGREISDFAVDFIYGMKATEELIRVAHAKLTGFGLTDEKIATSAALLGLNPETIQRNYENLRGIGLSDEKIATLAQLLNRDPETIQRNYENLRRIGLSNEKIAQQAALLSRDPETIQRNYDHHIGMLGGRGSGKSILTSQAQLLSRPPGTDDNGSKKSLASGGFAGTFQYLAYIDRMSGNGHAPTHRRNPMLLGTTPTNKREKIAWLLREVYDYRKLGPDEKKSAIKRVYRLVSDEPKLLLYSISTLKMRKDAIRQKVT